MLVNKNHSCGRLASLISRVSTTYKLDNGDATFHNKFAADDMTYDERYIDTMALENEFGDNLCCQSICDLFNIKLHVYHTTTMQWWHMSPTVHVDEVSDALLPVVVIANRQDNHFYGSYPPTHKRTRRARVQTDV
jgi:hypothetical protein